MADGTPHLVLALLHVNKLALHGLQELPSALFHSIQLPLELDLDHHYLTIDLGLQGSLSYGHSLVHIGTVGSIQLSSPHIHYLELTTRCRILKLHLGHLNLLNVL